MSLLTTCDFSGDLAYRLFSVQPEDGQEPAPEMLPVGMCTWAERGVCACVHVCARVSAV